MTRKNSRVLVLGLGLGMLSAACRRAPTQVPAQVESQPESGLQPETQPPATWQGLARGPYEVGYRTEIVFDPARTFSHPLARSSARPLVLARWYPAERRGEAMTVGDYLELELDAAGELERALELHLREVFAAELLSSFGEAFASPKQRGWLQAAAAEPCFATRNASALAGDWPLVLYHPGLHGSLADSFVLFEYLASHGFEVVSSSFVPPLANDLGIAWDPSTSIADLDFIVHTLHTRGELDDTRPRALMGHSYGAQAVLIYAMQGRRVDALVSIDSTLENGDPAAPWYRSGKSAPWFEQPHALRVPSLLLVSQYHTHTSFHDAMLHADRRLARVPVLDHNDFVSHGGALRTLHGHEVRAEEGSAEAFAAAYAGQVRAIHWFLAGVLADDAAALERLDHTWARSLDGASLVHSAAQPELDPAALLAAEGVAGLLARCAGGDSREPCDGVARVLDVAAIRRGRGELEQALALVRELATLQPDDPRVHDTLGELLLACGQASAGRAAFERALALETARGGDMVGFHRVRAMVARTIAEAPGTRDATTCSRE
jgi:hypothetical protein